MGHLSVLLFIAASSILFADCIFAAPTPTRTPSPLPLLARNSAQGTLNYGSAIGPVFRHMGVVVENFVGNLDSIRKVMKVASGNGIGYWFRTREFIDMANLTYAESFLFTDGLWRIVDMMLLAARENQAYVVINFDNFVTYAQLKGMQPYAQSTWPFYRRVIEYMTNRVNPYTGIRYRDDNTIMLYSIFEQPDPTRSSPDSIEQTFSYIAATIKANDPRHLIGSGGFLWMTVDDNPLDSQGRRYWDVAWRDPNLDVCMVNIYPFNHEASALGGVSEWQRLSQYSQFCRNIGKPFMIQDFALKKDNIANLTRVNLYWNFAFKSIRAATPALASVGVKNLKPDRLYGVWPIQEPTIFNLIRGYARVNPWNESPTKIANYLACPAGAVTVVINFNASTFLASQVDTGVGYGGTQVSVDSTFLVGVPTRKTLKFRYAFSSGGLQAVGVGLSRSKIVGVFNFWNWVQTNGKLYAQVFVPDTPILTATLNPNRGYFFKFILVSGAQRTEQTLAAAQNNYIVAGRWTGVYASLNPTARDVAIQWTNPAFITTQSLMSNIDQVIIQLVKPAKMPPKADFIWIDSLRLVVSDIRSCGTSSATTVNANSLNTLVF